MTAQIRHPYENTAPSAETPANWRDNAACANTDPDAFFPQKSRSGNDAKRVCATCPVREQCLQWALENNMRFGIWGGMTDNERRRIKKIGAGQDAEMKKVS